MTDLKAEFDKQVAATVAAKSKKQPASQCSHLSDSDLPNLRGWIISYQEPADDGIEGIPGRGWWIERWGRDELWLTDDGNLTWCHFRGSEGSAIQGTELRNWHRGADVVGAKGKPFSEMTTLLQRAQYR